LNTPFRIYFSVLIPLDIQGGVGGERAENQAKNDNKHKQNLAK